MDNDTIAEVPYATVLEWATYRTVDRQMRRNAAIRLAAAEGLVRSQRNELEVMQGAMQAQATDIGTLKAALGTERAARIDERNRADGYKAWATVGKMETILLTLSVVGAVTVSVLNSAR